MARRPARRPSRGSARRAYSSRRSSGRASAQRSYRSRARTSRPRRSASGGRSGRLVIEVVQAGAVRAGEPVGIGQKVASAPRLKPRF